MIAEVLNDQSDDTIVRQWAAKAVYRFTQFAMILSVIRSRALDSSENIDVRFNLVSGLATYERTTEKVQLLRDIAACSGDALGDAASRLLDEWEDH